MSIQDEYVAYYEWLSALRTDLRDIVLQHWDETGRPRVVDPVTSTLISLAKLHSNSQSSFDAFFADVKTTLMEHTAFGIDERVAGIAYQCFLQGTVWGAIMLRDIIREEFANRPTSDNP